MKNVAKYLSARSRSLLALFLAAVFVFSAFPAAMLAETRESEKAEVTESEPSKGNIASGTMDGTIYWWIEDNGNFKMRLLDSKESGSFTKKRFTSADWPWNDYRSQIKTVTIMKNAKGVGISFGTGMKEHSMFRDCENLTKVTINSGALDTTNAAGLASMFRGCTALETVDLSGLVNNGSMVDLSYMFFKCKGLQQVKMFGKSFKLAPQADLSYMFAESSFESVGKDGVVDMSDFDLSNAGKMEAMFRDCGSLTTVDLSSDHEGFRVLETVYSMKDMFRNCTSLETLILDGMDNSNIGPTNSRHSIYDDDHEQYVGAAEYNRDYGLKTCTSLKILSVNNAKVWMVNNEAGTPSHEYYIAANDKDVFWWWYPGENTNIKEEGTQLNFTSSITGETYVLNKRDYVDLITDRDGIGIPEEDQLPAPTPAPTPEPNEPDETPEPEDPEEPGEGAIGGEVVTRGGSVPVKEGESEQYNLPNLIGTKDIADRHTNINIINGDLNPNGPGFLAPGVYEVTTEPWTEEHVDMTGSAYGIDFKGVSHHVEVNGIKITSFPYYIDADGDGTEDIVIVKGTNNTYINTTKRDDWPTSDDYTIDLSNHKIAFVYDKASTEQGTETKRNVRIEFTSVTFKNLGRIPTNPGRGEHDGNKYYDTDGGGAYYRTIAQANAETGILFRNYLKISDPTTPGDGTSALSGGSGTDIDFTIKIDGAFKDSHFLFYSDDLDVGEYQGWVYPKTNDPCYDYLPYGNYNYGIGGESFVVHDSEDLVGPIRLAPNTGLIVVTNDDGSREVITTGSDPSTAWSEFSVLAKATGSDFTWRSGVACSTTALRNAVTNKETTEYVVYDFSNQLCYTLEPPTKNGEVITVEEGDVAMTILGISNKMKATSATTKTIGKFTFTKSGNDTVDIRIKGITDQTVELYALVQCNPKYSDAEIVWRKIIVMPATNVHYEESYLNYNSDSSKNYAESWNAVGKATNPVFDVSANNGKGSMTGTGKNRQSDDNTLYGYDATYAKQTGDSNNRSMHVTVGADAFKLVSKEKTHAWPEFSFTFIGNGFDIIGRAGLHTGVYVMNVKNKADQIVKSQMVNTRYYGTNWSNNGSNENLGSDLRQVPIIHIDDLAHDTYTVTVQLIWMKGLAAVPIRGASAIPGIPEVEYEYIGFENLKAAEDNYTFEDFEVYVDAIRIYNPIESDSKPIAYEAYRAAGELDPVYTEIKGMINTDSDLTEGLGDSVVSGLVAIDVTPHYIYAVGEDGTALLDDDGKPILADENGDPLPEGADPIYMMPQDGEFSAAELVQYGPNNEIYFTNGQGFAFKLTNASEISELHISAKAPYGTTQMKVALFAVKGGEQTPIVDIDPFEIKTATEMYYDLSKDLTLPEFIESKVGYNDPDELYVVISNALTSTSNDNILSVCEMKVVKKLDEEGTAPTPNVVFDRDAIELATAVIGGRKGDINADASIDMIDALLAMRTAMGSAELGLFGGYCADIDNNGQVAINDAMSIMRMSFNN